MIPWPHEAVRIVVFAGRQRLHSGPPPFLDPSLSFPFPFQQDYVTPPGVRLFLRAAPPELPAGFPPSA